MQVKDLVSDLSCRVAKGYLESMDEEIPAVVSGWKRFLNTDKNTGHLLTELIAVPAKITSSGHQTELKMRTLF